jgi:hypothetical protein
MYIRQTVKIGDVLSFMYILHRKEQLKIKLEMLPNILKILKGSSLANTCPSKPR